MKDTSKQEKELRSAGMNVGWVGGASWEFKYSIRNTCPLRAGSSAKLIFETLKVVVGTRKRMPVNVKKLASTVVTLGGTMKLERMSGSPALAIWMMGNEEISSEKNFMVEVLEAMELENLRYREWKS